MRTSGTCVEYGALLVPKIVLQVEALFLKGIGFVHSIPGPEVNNSDHTP